MEDQFIGKIKEHLQGWKTVENFIDANNKKEAEIEYKKQNFVNKDWREVEEEYRLIDTEINLINDLPIKTKGNVI